MRTLLVGLMLLAASGGVALAKPTKADVAQGKKLYKAAEAEQRAGKFAEAAKDYTGAYDLTRDPALLFKVGSAHQSAGACDAAVAAYRQYLAEASPSPKFIALTHERIAACHAPVDAPVAPPVAPPPAPPVEVRAEVPPLEPAPPVAPAPVAAPPPAVATKLATASADEGPEPGHARDAAWAYAGGAALFGGAGIVLYAQGHQAGSSGYKDASYASFGLGGLLALTSVYFFVRRDPHHHADAAMIAPTADAHSAGVAARFTF